MQYSISIGRCIVAALGLAIGLGVFTPVLGARLESPSFQIDTNIGGNFSGQTSSSSYQMESIGGEAVIGNGAGGSYKLTQQPATTTSPTIEMSLPVGGLTFGALTSGTSQAVNFNLGVQATSAYSVSIEQNRDLQTAGATASIPAVGGTTDIPEVWNEGTTVGLGYSVVSAPLLSSKWGSGNNFAALPNLATVFYDGESGNHTLSMRLRLDVDRQQVADTYTNLMTVTGVATP